MKVVGFINVIGAHQAYRVYMEPFGTHSMLYTYSRLLAITHPIHHEPISLGIVVGNPHV